MSDNKSQPTIIPTIAKVLMDDWETLTRIIRQIATPVGHKGTEKDNTLLTDAMINDAVSGPYHPFLSAKLKAFGEICEYRMLITVSENEALQEKVKDISKEENPKLKIAKKLSICELDKRQHQLDELTNEHFSTWQSHIKTWLATIENELNTLAVPLSELEHHELYQLEPISQLAARFIELDIEMPKNKKDYFNFATYLHFKTTLIVQSSLGRRQLPHQKKDIEQITKKLKNTFSEIEKTENSLASEQAKATEAISLFS